MKNLKEVFSDKDARVKFIYNSNAIEGSTLTLCDTKKVLENHQIILEGKSQKEVCEVIGFSDAIDYLVSVVDEDIDLLILINIHQKLMTKVNPNIAGVIRTNDSYTYVDNGDATIAKHFYLDWTLIPSELNKIQFNVRMDLEDIVKLKCDFVQIHPFIDGNGRLSRLLLNWLLYKNSYGLVDLEGAPKSRKSYIDAMAQTNGVTRNYQPIIDLIISHLDNNPLRGSDIF